ncbi:hypothetical protein DQ04_07151020 [Trypanosoma grayi]|uniref:hypothetical protein n=1 Tax=Trypanosoma grayi TaxID=71804 RepID=UPI0004F41288|nr:hypothetical protein DQ04_07151020 [Trypanosoma grayi]KEG08455.1 hypothetical protein DQ04_07151020 [Trypanosoma grayi]
MSTLKICSLLSSSEDGFNAMQREFDHFPNGMTMDVFREVLSRHMAMKRGRTVGCGWLHAPRSTVRNTREESRIGLRSVVKSAVSSVKNHTSTLSSHNIDAVVSTIQQEGVLDALHDSYRMSLSVPRRSSRQRLDEYTDINAFEVLFKKIDGDGDGFISWDDVLQLAVEEATQSITIMTEEMRSYSFSRNSPRMKLIQVVHALPQHKSLFAAVTRADPLMLLSRRDFSVVKKFSSKDLGDTHPQLIEYLPHPDVLLAYSPYDKTIRGWWSVVSCNRMGTLNPLVLDDALRRIRTQPRTMPHSFFTGGSHGSVVHWQVPRQRSVMEVSQARIYGGLHSRDAGGITDFALTDEWLLSTGFDHRLLSTNLETGRSILIGRPRETIRFVEYNRQYACLPCVTYSNRLMLWDVRSSAVTPGAVFRDDSAKQHMAEVIGLCNALGLPQVVTTDSAGWVKIWDLRMLRCMQTLYADGSVGDELNVDFIYGDQVSYQDTESLAHRAVRKGDARCIRSLGYFPSTQEILCSSSEAIYCLRYNHRLDGRVADVDVVQSAYHDLRQGTIILQGATRTSVWDAVDGFRKRVFDRAVCSDVPYWQQEVLAMCLDHPRSRAFFAVADGMVEVRSTKTFGLVDTFRMHEAKAQEMMFTTRHNFLVSIAVNGTLTLRRENDAGVSSTTIGVSSQPLRALTLSDEVGLICCCDDCNLFFVDFKQVKMHPFSISVSRPVRAMAMLGKFPVLATGSDDGELALWSTPPAEESHAQLVSLFIGQPEPTAPRRAAEKTGGASMCTVPLSQHSVTTAGSPTGSPPLPPQTTEPEECTLRNGSPDILNVNKKKLGFDALLRLIAADDQMNGGLSAIACDDISHRLFVADQKGNLFIYSLCPFLQAFGIQPCSFENRTRYQLCGVNRNDSASYIPHILHSASVHKSPVNYMSWFPALSAIISCGADHLVKILDHDGKETGQLLMDRLPPGRILEDAEDVDHAEHWVRVSEESVIPFSLPIPISGLTVRHSCPTMAARVGVCHSSVQHESSKGMSLLPVLTGRPGGSVVSWGMTEPPAVQLGEVISGIHVEDVGVVQSKIAAPFPAPETARLVALEEKKQWRPQKEKPRAFRERDHESPPRSLYAGIENSATGAGTRQRGRSIPEVLVQSTEWCKPVSLPTTLVHEKKSRVGTSAQPNDDGNSIARLTAFSEGLSLCGVSMTPSEGGALRSCGLPPQQLKLDSSESRRNGRKSARRGEKGKLQPAASTRPETGDTVATERIEPLLESALRAYEKELHRCIRGKLGKERLYRGVDNAGSPTAFTPRSATGGRR